MLLLLKRCQGAVGPPARVAARWRVASLTCAVAVPSRCCSSEASTSAHSSSGASAPPSPQWSSGPLTVYTHGIETGKYRADPQQARSACRAACAHSLSRQIAQLEAVRKLQRVWDDVKAVGGLAEEEHSSSGLTLVDSLGGSSSWGHSSLWQRLARKLEAPPAPPPPVRGLYLFGGVGTGKTMLMDVFYDSLTPGARKKRIHFLDFMLDVHRRLRHMKNVADPLHAVAQEFTRMNKPGGGRLVLCLDEFMVTDVADAMILKRLFTHLFDCGLVLVSTSNRAPDRLYEGGLQRALFLPFIALLKNRCEVHDIQGSQDYRRLARKLSQSLFFTGPSAATELQTCMELFAPGKTPASAVVQVMMGRTLHVPRAAGRVAHFSFADLCEQPVAAADFIALCESYHTILLEGVPVLDASTRAAAYRLVALVDVVYEQRARLILAAQGQPASLFENIVTQAEFHDAKSRLPAEAMEQLCVDDNVGFSKERCVSRLLEMSSIHYARQWATRHAPELLPSLPPEDGTLV